MAGPTLTQDLTGNPWVEVFFNPADLDPACTSLRIYRLSENRTWLVRGGVDIAPGVAALDFEVPFQTACSYRAEMFDVSGVSLGFTDITETTVNVSDMWVHNPLDPTRSVNLGPHGIRAESMPSVRRPTVGETVWVEGSTVGRRVGSGRRGVVGGMLGFVAETLATANALQAMLGTYEVQQVGVLCVRTPPPTRIPRTLFAGVRDPEEVDLDTAWGGTRTDFWFSFDEVAPPFPGLVKPLLTYDDIDTFGTYTAQDANWSTYTDRDRAYELAGLAEGGI